MNGNPPGRIVPHSAASKYWYGAILILLLLFLGADHAFGQNRAQEEWKRKLEERRAQALQQKTNAKNEEKETATQPAKEETTGRIVINGKVIRTRKKPKPVATPATARSPRSATGSVQNATGNSQPVGAPPPTPTPALVKIKKTKIIGGKILTVEIEVTPTPSPSSPETPEDARSTAKPVVPEATGIMLEVRENLQKVAQSPTGSLRFKAKMIALLREEFVKHKNDPHAKKILDTTQAVRIQSDLQRLSSIARGGNIDAKTAKILLEVLFPPPPKPEADTEKPSRERVSIQASSSETEDPGTVSEETATEDLAAGEESQEPEYYYDPQTGLYYYSDGTPVETGEQEPIQYYYDQDGNLYYELDGEIYYLEEGQ